MIMMSTSNEEKLATLFHTVRERLAVQALPVTDPVQWARVLDEVLAREWSRNKARIPVDTGKLREILTSRRHPDRRVKVSGSRVEVEINHGGAKYRRNVPQVDFSKVSREAIETLMRRRV